MRVSLIQAPYHLGRAGVDVAAGPIKILEAGAAEALREAGHDVEVEAVLAREERDGDDVYWNNRLGALRERVADVYLHLDLDVLDRSEGIVNHDAARGRALRRGHGGDDPGRWRAIPHSRGRHDCRRRERGSRRTGAADRRPPPRAHCPGGRERKAVTA